MTRRSFDRVDWAALLIAHGLVRRLLQGELAAIDGDAVHFAVNAFDVSIGCGLTAAESDALEQRVARQVERLRQ